jgi:hypothetical protein
MKNLRNIFYEKIMNSFNTIFGKKKLAFVLAGLLCLSSTTGCQLAKESMSSSEDTLIGVYVTTDYIDTYDWDNFSISSSGSVSVKQRDDGKVYGTLDSENDTISFPNIDGFAFLNLSKVKDGETYQASIATEHFCETYSDISDNGNEISTSLYYDSNKAALQDETESSFYLHPIYQTAGGDVYFIAGKGGFLITNGEMSTTFSNSKSAVSNGKTDTSLTEFTINVKSATPAETVVFTQVAENGTTLQEDTYTAEQFPETYTRKNGCAYILVAITDSDGNTRYETINAEDETFSLFLPTDDIFCDEVMIEVENQ